MEYTFDSRWFQGVAAEDVENLKSQLISDKKTLDNLKKIVYNMIRKLEDVRTDDYESPSWSHKQAHRNGLLEAYGSICRLISLDKGETSVT
jgi:hypothetical protein